MFKILSTSWENVLLLISQQSVQNWCQWVYRFIQYQCYDIIFKIVIWHQVWPTKSHIWFPKRFEEKRCASYQMSQKNLQLSGREAATYLWWRLSAKDPGVCSGAMLVMVVMLPWCLWHGKRSWQTQTIDEHNPPPAPPPHHHHHNISIMICIMVSLTSSQHVNIRGASIFIVLATIWRYTLVRFSIC